MWAMQALRRSGRQIGGLVAGGGIAYFAGAALGEEVFGEELPFHESYDKNYFLDLKNQPLVPRGERFEREQGYTVNTFYKPHHKVQLSPEEWRMFPLESAIKSGKDGAIFRFQLPSIHGRCGLDCTSYVLLRYKDSETGKYIVRPYTPVSMDWEFGHFDLLIKRYPDGKMGNHLFNMKKGDRVQVKGPFKKIPIGPRDYTHIGLIGGGSGITPLFQVMMYLSKHQESDTNCSLIYANNTPEEILMPKALKTLQYSDRRMRVYHTVMHGTDEWRGGLGYVSKEMIKSKMPAPGEGKILVCGPPPMVEALAGKKDGKEQGPLGGVLKEMGYSEKDVYKF